MGRLTAARCWSQELKPAASCEGAGQKKEETFRKQGAERLTVPLYSFNPTDVPTVIFHARRCIISAESDFPESFPLHKPYK